MQNGNRPPGMSDIESGSMNHEVKTSRIPLAFMIHDSLFDILRFAGQHPTCLARNGSRERKR